MNYKPCICGSVLAANSFVLQLFFFFFPDGENAVYKGSGKDSICLAFSSSSKMFVDMEEDWIIVSMLSLRDRL